MSSYKSTILITGGTNGLGFEAAKKLAHECPDRQIVIASRTNNQSADKINSQTGQKNVIFKALDQSDLNNVRAFARSFSGPPISAILLNAGLQFPTGFGHLNGVERTFMINHVGGSLLFHLLASHLTRDARIVITSSGVHDPETAMGMPPPQWSTAEEMARPSETSKDGRIWYTNSKLANMLWAYALDRRIKTTGKAWTVTTLVSIFPNLEQTKIVSQTSPRP
jgi:NAD(P)-dependent dehydrogenase (short-subunit alcohol dehydrogenase family)